MIFIAIKAMPSVVVFRLILRRQAMKQNLITDIINKMRPAVIKNKFTTVEEYKRNNLIEQGDGHNRRI